MQSTKKLWVYFIRYGDQVKIGVSELPLRRFLLIQSSCPVRLEFLGAMPGSRADEMALHARFAPQRRRFEWFTATDDLLAFIADNATKPEQQTASNPHDRRLRRFKSPSAAEWVPYHSRDPYRLSG
jgi:hypothetical protein